jgi:hypothetical protein
MAELPHVAHIIMRFGWRRKQGIDRAPSTVAAEAGGTPARLALFAQAPPALSIICRSSATWCAKAARPAGVWTTVVRGRLATNAFSTAT